MLVTIFYLKAPPDGRTSPTFVPIRGEFPSVDNARQAAFDTATKHRHFKDWCVRFEIEDESGNIIAEWSADDANWT